MSSIQFSAGLDLTELKTKLAQASTMAQTHGAQIRKSFGNLELMGDRRVRRNVAALTTDLIGSGNAADAAANAFGALSNTFKIGIGTGVGLAAVGAVIATISKNVTEAREHMHGLTEETKKAAKAAFFEGPEQGTSKLLEQAKASMQLARKAHDEGRELDPSKHPVKAISNSVWDLITTGDPSKSRKKALALELTNQNRANKERGDAIIAAREELGITRENVEGNETAAKLMKQRLDFAKQMAALKTLKAPQSVIDSARQTFDVGRQALLDEDQTARGRQVSASRIAGMFTGDLTPSQQRMEAIKEHIGQLSTSMGQKSHTEQDRTEMGIDRVRAGNELLAAQFEEHEKPWAQRAAEMRQQQKLTNYFRSQTPSNPNAYITHRDAYNQMDILGNRPSAPYQPVPAGAAQNSSGGGDTDMGDLHDILSEIKTTLDQLVSGDN